MTEPNDRERKIASDVCGWLGHTAALVQALADYRAELHEQHRRELAEVNKRLSDERFARQEASADAVLSRAELRGARHELDRAEESLREHRHEAQLLIGQLLDVLVLPGHALSRDVLERACLLGGRYAEPFLSWSKD